MVAPYAALDTTLIGGGVNHLRSHDCCKHVARGIWGSFDVIGIAWFSFAECATRIVHQNSAKSLKMMVPRGGLPQALPINNLAKGGTANRPSQSLCFTKRLSHWEAQPESKIAAAPAWNQGGGKQVSAIPGRHAARESVHA